MSASTQSDAQDAADQDAAERDTPTQRPRTPFADRPTASAPGHWVLARMGKKVLRPGGAELSRRMLDHAGLAGADVVEFAPGLGHTAAQVMAAAPASYTGVDADPEAVRTVSAVVGPAGTVRHGDAAATGLPDACADVVIGEAMLTMQGEAAKKAIIGEAARLLRPGGRYVIHELAVTPDDIDPAVHTEIRKALARAIHVNARPLTPAQWAETLQEAGLVVEWTDTAPMALLDARRNLADEGPVRMLRIMWNLLRDGQMRSRVMAMRRTFKEHEKNMCGVALVARRPHGESEPQED
ncbi:methyltransferase domain-containing protein [Schaalia sp. 19OD2882]|uniref:class I SAM-dependent methyltransferase n=1 Tax=Schaalia sp. 19OD2882 TaxID=2794089 RepID=UPI001C1EB348|nr:class I SAM-dependent methyltransferase [Schaalia sp. 19OD2882]QWW19195.1 methyltransferase domain-containing protein [Schaalia sp. 19OD2882]